MQIMQNSIHRSDRDGMISGARLFVNRLGARPAIRRFYQLLIQRLQIFSPTHSCEELLEPAYPRLEEFLTTVGRRKYLKPLYEELVKTPDGRARAETIYKKARAGYHPIAVTTVDGILHNLHNR